MNSEELDRVAMELADNPLRILAVLAVAEHDDELLARLAERCPLEVVGPLCLALTGPNAAAAATMLESVLVEPRREAPSFSPKQVEALEAALTSPQRWTAATVCLACGVLMEPARDALIAAAHQELDREGLDYDLGCALQDVFIALRRAPWSDDVIGLADRVFPEADGPLRAVAISTMIRPEVPPDLLAGWSAHAREYSVDGYAQGEALQLNFAERFARGEALESLVAEVAALPDLPMFARFAVSRCIEAASRVSPMSVFETLVTIAEADPSALPYLEAVDLGAYEGAFGPATGVAHDLVLCWSQEEDTASAAANAVGETIAHQGTLYEVTAPVLPKIAAVVADPHVSCSQQLEGWLEVVTDSAHEAALEVDDALDQLSELGSSYAIISEDDWRAQLEQQHIYGTLALRVLRLLGR